MTLHKTLKQ